MAHLQELMDSQSERELHILEYLEQNPETTQADLATRLGVAVGSINWYVKRLISKGYLKVSKLQRRRLRYLITPQGIAKKARLTQEYMEVSLRLYRETRAEARRLLSEVTRAGYGAVSVEGEGDLAEICRLTCLEQRIKVRQDTDDHEIPTLAVEGTKMILHWPPGGTARLS